MAEKLFAGTKYQATTEDIEKLADNMDVLEERGIGKLNQRLIDSGRGVWATIAEHNFAVLLVKSHDSSVSISYEPEINGRPPDFKVGIAGVTYWIQMKDLAKLERENRQDKTIERIKKDTKGIRVGKFFSCMLSDDFKEDCLPKLIAFIGDKAPTAKEDESFLFTGENAQKAEIKFWQAKEIDLTELTLGYAGDLQILNITGLAKDQIKRSLRNAVGAFTWEVGVQDINLIVMEADNKKDIDICDALFGTEYELFNGSVGYLEWSRKDDGLFKDHDFSKKVAGIIAIKRKPERFKESEITELPSDAAGFANYLKKECGWTDDKIREALENKKGKTPGPVADYYLVLYVNVLFKNRLEDIKRLLSFNKIVYYNMRPPMGEGNFKL